MSRAVLALLTVAALSMHLAGCDTGDSSSSANAGSTNSVEAVESSLARRLIPTTEGGWAMSMLQEQPVPDVWLMAAALAASAGDAAAGDADDALDATADLLDDALLNGATDVARPMALAVSLASATGIDMDVELVRSAFDRASVELEEGDVSFLGPVLNFSRPMSPVANDASATLERIYGEVSCDELDGLVASPPAPQESLVVVSRRLAVAEGSCEQATQLFDILIDDPRWDTSLGAFEISDLVLAAPEDENARMRSTLAPRMTHWLDMLSTPQGEIIPLSLVLMAAVGAEELDVDVALPVETRYRVDGQRRFQGRLGDVSTSPPQIIDQLVQEMLVTRGYLEAEILEETRASVMDVVSPEMADVPAELVIGRALLFERRPPTCDEAATVIAGPSQRTEPVTLVGSRAAEAAASLCDDTFDVETFLAPGLAGQTFGAPVIETWAALFALCLVEPSEVPGELDNPPSLEGPFEEDPFFMYAWLFTHAPEISCDELRAETPETESGRNDEKGNES